MVERQPGRPDENEFIGAARRLLANEYDPVQVHVPNGSHANMFVGYPGKVRDSLIIMREEEAEGKKGEYETLEDFAIRQLGNYQKLRKD
jgi:hypothetical protein